MKTGEVMVAVTSHHNREDMQSYGDAGRGFRGIRRNQ